MKRTLALAAILTLGVAAPAAAQSPSPTPLPITGDFGCIVDVTDTLIPMDGSFIDPVTFANAILAGTVKTDGEFYCMDKSDLGDTDDPDPDEVPQGEVPFGTMGTVDDGAWEVTVTDFVNSAWRAIKAENMFNDAPRKNDRIVLITLRIRNQGDSARDPFFGLRWSLFSRTTDDGFPNYSGVLPRDLSDVNSLPPGRRGTGTIAFTVPKSVKSSDLILYIQGDDTYAEFDPTR